MISSLISAPGANFDDYLDQVHQSSGAGAFTEMATEWRWRNDEYNEQDEPTTSSIGRQRPLRGVRSARADSGMANPLSPTTTSDDPETRIKKLRSQLNCVDRMGYTPDEARRTKLELISELSDLGVDDAFGGPSAKGGPSREESEVPWA